MQKMRVVESVNALGAAICLHDFVNAAKFTDVEIPIDITRQMQSELSDCHPSMIIGGGKISLVMYQITFTYDTKRGNQRKGKKYLFRPEESMLEEGYEDSIMVETEFENWVINFNTHYPYRAISNVKVLDIAVCAKASLSIA